ncbi:MAG: 2-hydroxychromene-2-carboxylate isomerase [Comamonadaceae bacterium]|nr:MAG: 2-hydroxychromene-2-carboxylate isomerase [Comamonadaceae bacterium]
MIEFFFDCSSPWTYIAFRNIQPMAAALQTPIDWRPVLVGGIFNTVNQNVYAAREDMSSPRNRYLMKDVQDNARQAGLTIVFPPRVFPVNSVKAMRGCLWIAQDATAKPHLLAFIEAVFAAYFTREEDISQDAVLGIICAEAGIDFEAFLKGIAQPDIKEQLKANTDEAIRRGAFGAPTFFVGDDMYFGNDRLSLVKAAVERKQST